MIANSENYVLSIQKKVNARSTTHPVHFGINRAISILISTLIDIIFVIFKNDRGILDYNKMQPRPGFYRTQYPASYTHKSLGRTPQFTLPAFAGTQTCLLCLSLKSQILRNFFGERNAETDQEPSSSGCSESDQSKSSKKTSPPKKIENSYLAG